MDFKPLLIEIQSLLGNLGEAEEIRSSILSPDAAAQRFMGPGNTLVDEAVLESLAHLDWNQVAQIAAFSLIPEGEVVALSRALSEGTNSFRAAWHGMTERYEVPDGVTRSGFILASRISPDDGVMRRLVRWSKAMLGEADDSTRDKLAKEAPALAHAAFVPAGDKARARREAEDAKNYLEPHRSKTRHPSEKSRVMTTRIFQCPDAREKQRDRSLKDVERELSKLEKTAHKSGKRPEEMFPLLFRDLMRERARFS